MLPPRTKLYVICACLCVCRRVSQAACCHCPRQPLRVSRVRCVCIRRCRPLHPAVIASLLSPSPPPSSLLLPETPRRNPCGRHPNAVCPDRVCGVQGHSRWERPYPPGEAGVGPIGVLLPTVLPVRIVLCRSVLYSAARCRAHLRSLHMRGVTEDISWNVWCVVVPITLSSHPLFS